MNASTHSQRLMGRGAAMALAGVALLAFANPMIVNGLTLVGYGLLLAGLLMVARHGR